MQYAVVIVIGLVAGTIELYLLSKFIKAIFSADIRSGFLLVPAKLIVLMIALAVDFFVAPQLLWLAGSAIVLPLIVGAIYSGIKGMNGKKESK